MLLITSFKPTCFTYVENPNNSDLIRGTPTAVFFFHLVNQRKEKMPQRKTDSYIHAFTMATRIFPWRRTASLRIVSACASLINFAFSVHYYLTFS